MNYQMLRTCLTAHLVKPLSKFLFLKIMAQHFLFRFSIVHFKRIPYFPGAISLEHIRQSSFERKISVVKTETFPALENVSLIDFSDPLLSIRSLDVRIVILNCPGKYAKQIFDVALSLGMLSSEWVWIVSDAIATEVCAEYV